MIFFNDLGDKNTEGIHFVRVLHVRVVLHLQNKHIELYRLPILVWIAKTTLDKSLGLTQYKRDLKTNMFCFLLGKKAEIYNVYNRFFIINPLFSFCSCVINSQR